MFTSKKSVISIATVAIAAYYSAMSSAMAQAGGLQAAATSTGNAALNLLLAIMPIVMIILLIVAALMLASRKFGLAWIGAVLAGAFVAGKADMFLSFVGVTV